MHDAHGAWRLRPRDGSCTHDTRLRGCSPCCRIGPSAPSRADAPAASGQTRALRLESRPGPVGKMRVMPDDDRKPVRRAEPGPREPQVTRHTRSSSASGREDYSRTTRDVRVSVRSFYLADQSQPDENHFVWAYRVKIENQGRV